MMLNSRHGVGINQVSSFNPAYQICSNGDGSGDIEFDFWGAPQTWYYDSYDGFEIEFQVQGASNEVTDGCPLLFSNHFSSILSPATRRKVIEEGRKEMMEMIRNMPESSYELSLKDIVEAQHASEEVVNGKVVSDDKSFDFQAQAKKQKQSKKKRKKRKAGQICRSASGVADSFLLKMVLPCSIRFRKKSAAEHSSKVSPTLAPESSEKPVDKQWWIKRFFMRKNHKKVEDGSSSSSSSSSFNNSNINKIRHNRSFLPSCWLFFLSNKRKDRETGTSHYLKENLGLKLL